jgi:hypothetical protein
MHTPHIQFLLEWRILILNIFYNFLSNKKKWPLDPHLRLLTFTKSQIPFLNSKLFVRNEHLKLSLSMFVFGSFLAQYGNKLVELDTILTAIRKRIQWDQIQLPILKFKYTMSDFQIFLNIGGVDDKSPPRLHATRSELGVATLCHIYRPFL